MAKIYLQKPQKRKKDKNKKEKLVQLVIRFPMYLPSETVRNTKRKRKNKENLESAIEMRLKMKLELSYYVILDLCFSYKSLHHLIFINSFSCTYYVGFLFWV